MHEVDVAITRNTADQKDQRQPRGHQRQFPIGEDLRLGAEDLRKDPLHHQRETGAIGGTEYESTKQRSDQFAFDRLEVAKKGTKMIHFFEPG